MRRAPPRFAMRVRQFVPTNFCEPRKQCRLTAIACEIADGLDQRTLDDVFQSGGIQCRPTCDKCCETRRAGFEELIECALLARAHSRYQRAIRLVHPGKSFASRPGLRA